jgi:two-component system CheB/CheR fusion protein
MADSTEMALKVGRKQDSSEIEKPATPLVAIGASAGGLEALQIFFENFPAQSGCVFVVITHQKQGSTSLLPELLNMHSEIPVVSAEDKLPIESGHIYIAPNTGFLSINDREFQILSFDKVGDNEDIYHPIDHFFISLGQSPNYPGICIVMSGTGSDGSVGLQSISENGGLVITQEPMDAAFAGMPASAIATGLVDYILKAEDIPAALNEYLDSLRVKSKRVASNLAAIPDGILDQIFFLLRKNTGHDFSSYKKSTLFRRIERRMMLQQISEPLAYVHYLQQHPQEVELLLKELLIRVTSFFRDPDVWESVAGKKFDTLLSNISSDNVVRVWVPGCSTGQEAYSIAMLLRERMERLKTYCDVTIFATDLDNEAIDIARKGVFPDGIGTEVSDHRLQKYFYHEGSSYIIRKEIREMIIFAEQNAIKDPPFTKVDLISCRNLLIYMNSDLQQSLLTTFHYALKPGGLLILGPSETVGSLAARFEVVDKPNKIYRSKQANRRYDVPTLPLDNISGDATKSNPLLSRSFKEKQKFSQNVLKLLATRFAPVCIIINPLGEIQYIHGKTSAYLEMGEGRPRNNLLDMAREGLRIEFSSALRTIGEGDQSTIQRKIKVKSENGFRDAYFSLEKINVPDMLRGLLLLVLTPVDEQEIIQLNYAEKGISSSLGEHRLADEGCYFEKELKVAQESYQTILEELESSNEELKSANEELQSTNEEMQSTNEELETTKEEMQSLNEELYTVNAELQSKLDELSYANDDMQNLLNGTDVATIFLDDGLCIKRYTKKANELIALRPNDLGRPLGELASNLCYDSLIEDANKVLESLVPHEVKLQTRSGAWYLLRILPYRTTENVINGLVCTFIDIGKVRLAELRGDYLKGIVDALHESIVVVNEEFIVCAVNKSFLELFKLKTEQIINQPLFEVTQLHCNMSDYREELNLLREYGKPIDNIDLNIYVDNACSDRVCLSGKRVSTSINTDNLIVLTLTRGPSSRTTKIN